MLADAQAEQRELEAEGVEFDTLQAGRHGCVGRKLLIGDALGDTRQDQKAKQAVADQHERHPGERTLHSIGHDRKYSWRMVRSEEHTSELQSLMRISYAVFCLKKKNKNTTTTLIT